MDRRKMLALLGLSPALAAATPPFARLAPASLSAAPAGGACASESSAVTVLNPGIVTKLADRIPLAPRLRTLEGKTVYLVDTDWGGMEQNGGILHEMQAWFAQHMPSVKTIYKIKRGNFVTDDPGLWKEFAENRGNGVIIGVAG
jgi:hypothetical protein